MIGQVVLERYEVLRRIGAGGMGAVYVGKQKAVSRDVALKILRTDLVSNEHIRERFRREAEIIGKLRHPNTIQLIDYGETEEGLAVMVMELLVGKPLNDRLKELGPLPLSEALTVGHEIASSLSEAHLIGLVHRDLKPANIFLVEVAGQTHVKVLDFGIARILDEEATRLTSTGQVFGTPRYMSPEQALSTGEVDARSDLYSLGLIVYECIVGQPPFVANTSIQYLSAHSTQRPPKLRERFPAAPEVLEALIDACLAKEPQERPETADQVADAFEAIKRSVDTAGAAAPILITLPPTWRASTSTQTGAPGTLPGSSGARPSEGVTQTAEVRTRLDDATALARDVRPPRSPLFIGGAILLALAVLMGGLVWFLEQRSRQPEIIASAEDGGLAPGQRGGADAGASTAALAGSDGGVALLAAAGALDSGSEGMARALDRDDAGMAEPSGGGTEDGGASEDAGRALQAKGSRRKRANDDAGIVLMTQQGAGVITGPASMVLPVDDTSELLEVASNCRDSVLKGNARLTLRGCPDNCVIVVDEKCGGRTPATDLPVPPGYHDVAVVCGARIELSTQKRFVADEGLDLRCR